MDSVHIPQLLKKQMNQSGFEPQWFRQAAMSRGRATRDTAAPNQVVRTVAGPRSCVKVEVAVLCSPSLISTESYGLYHGRKATLTFIGQRRSEEHWNRFKGNVGETSETETPGWSGYGLFRAHRYHLELN